MQRTNYRFTLTRDTDTFEVFPEGFYAGSFKYEQEEGQLFFRRNYNGDLSFRGSDYDYIKSRYDTGNYCDVYELLIEKRVSGVYQVDWMGFFSMTDGKFDFDRCRFKVNPITQDKYSCLLNNWETKYNILSLNKKSIISDSLSFYFFVSYFDPSPPSSFDCGLDLIKVKTVVYTDCSTEFGDCEAVDVSYTAGLYANEIKLMEKETVPVGLSWVKWTEGDTCDQYLTAFIRDKANNYDVYYRSFISGGNALPADDDVLLIANVCQPEDCSQTSPTPSDLGYSGEWYKAQSRGGLTFWLKTSYYNGQKIDTSNLVAYKGVYVPDAIKYLLAQTCQDTFSTPVLVSDFLTNSTNPVTGTASKTNFLYLVQKSDAKRPSSSNPATKGEMSLRELLESLYNTFQLWWHIDDLNNLVIIHQSEIEGNAGINITLSPYIETTAHKNTVDFDKSLLFRYETWSFMESKGDDFTGMPIEYAELCTIKDNNNKTKSYEISIITTDIGYIQSGFDKISDNGFALIAADSSNNVINEVGEITSCDQINGHLSLSNLHDKYWRHNRILSTGKMNGSDEVFISTQKIRKLSEQNIIFCGVLNPLEYITTEQGSAIVNEAEFFPLDNKLVLNMSI